MKVLSVSWREQEKKKETKTTEDVLDRKKNIGDWERREEGTGDTSEETEEKVKKKI